jgi:hypothetical protein
MLIRKSIFICLSLTVVFLFFGCDDFFNTASVEDYVQLEDVHISHINSVWLVYVEATIKNISNDRTIKYAYFDVEVYNAVDDQLYEDIDGSGAQRMKYTGPLDPGKSETKTWEIGYFTEADYVKVDLVGVDFMNDDVTDIGVTY